MTQRGQVKALKFVRIYDRKTLRVTLKKQKRKKRLYFCGNICKRELLNKSYCLAASTTVCLSCDAGLNYVNI